MKARKILAAIVSVMMAAGQPITTGFAEEYNEELPDAVGSVSDDGEPTDGEDELPTDGETAIPYDLGDVNGDCKVNISDISALAAHIKNIDSLKGDALTAADANLDGIVNIADLNLVVAHVKGIESLEGFKNIPEADEAREKTDAKTSQELLVSKGTNNIVWNAAAGMKSYVIRFSNGDDVYETTSTATSARIRYEMFKDGKLRLQVTPKRYVRLPDGKVAQDYGSSFAYTLLIKPEPITGGISISTNSGKATLSWADAEFASGYRIYHTYNDDRAQTLIADVKDCTYTLDTAEGDAYDLLIVPYNSVGEAAGSDVSFSAQPSAPQLESASTDLHSITLKWNAVSNADGYEVALEKDGEWETFTTEDTSFTFGKLQMRTEYNVKVRSYTGDGDNKICSEYTEDSAMTDGTLKCGYGTSVYLSKDYGSTILGWVSAYDVVQQKGTSENGWTMIYVPGTNRTQVGYVPSSAVHNYTDLGLTVINQDSWAGGQPAVLGSEETALASVLDYQFGFNVSKNTLLDSYMPTAGFENGTINADPNYAFWGSPYQMENGVGYGVYAPVIAQSAHKYITDCGVRDSYSIALNTDYYTGDNRNSLKFDPEKLELGDTKLGGGLDLEGLKAELDKGNNLIVWYSKAAPSAVTTQYLREGGDYTNPGNGGYYFTWYGTQNTAVLTGYDDMTGCFIISNVENPNSGSETGTTDQLAYDFFMQTYEILGRQSVVISKN